MTKHLTLLLFIGLAFWSCEEESESYTELNWIMFTLNNINGEVMNYTFKLEECGCDYLNSVPFDSYSLKDCESIYYYVNDDYFICNNENANDCDNTGSTQVADTIDVDLLIPNINCPIDLNLYSNIQYQYK